MGLSPAKSNTAAPGPLTTIPCVKSRSTGTGFLGSLRSWERSALMAAPDDDEPKISAWTLSGDIKAACSICGEPNRKLCNTSPSPSLLSWNSCDWEIVTQM